MRANRHSNRFYVGMGVAMGVVLLPILLLRDFTISNELRYLSIADEALRQHTCFAFTNHGEPYADKPPLYLWIVMLCRWLTGAHRMWLLALFSLLPAWGTWWIMEQWSAGQLSEKGCSLARWMMGSCALFLGLAITLRMDMLMTFFIVLALRSFWQMATAGAKRERWLFPVWLFLALFTKGPLGLLIPLCGTAVFLLLSKRIKEMPRYWGWRTWGVLLLGCGLWFGAVYAEGGSDYLQNLLFRQTAGRAVHSFHHARPFYYYAVSIWYTLVPWSLLVVGSMVAALRPGFVRSELQRFFLCIGVTTLLLLSCISAKLEVYLLPAVPFLIYATAMLLPRFKRRGWVRIALTLPATIFTAALPLFPVVVKAGGLSYLHQEPLYLATATLTLSGALSLWLLYGKRHTVYIGHCIQCMGFGMLFALYTGGWALPKLNAYIGYGTLCRQALEVAQRKGYTEFHAWRLPRAENLDVYLHQAVKVVSTEEFPVYEGRPFLLLTQKKHLRHFPDRETQTVGPYAIVLCP